MGVTVSVQPGDVIGGTYVIERLLGEGGMGAVFVANEERLGRRVAIKVLLSAVADNPEAVARFEREARSAAALQSDHVTRVLSIGKLDGGAPYIVMELLEGEDLASLLAKRGALAPLEVAELMLPVCEALTEAHAIGIVHRDLKPANIFLARRPTGATTVKVLDFGISKSSTTSASPALTKTTAVMGTPLYMSPEQLREAKSVDGRADVWALGIVMYELLSGAPPFVSDAMAELCAFILTVEPQPLGMRRPDMPPALSAIVSRCLQKDPASRFADVRELRAALSAFVASGGAPAPAPPREATPRMNPNELAGMPTAAIAARARAQAPTQAPGAKPPLSPPPPAPVPAYAPPMAPPTHAPAMTPPTHAPIEPRPMMARTVDPVSSTTPELASSAPSPPWLGIALAFGGTLIVAGGLGLYVAFRPPAAGTGSGVVESSAPSAEPVSAAVTTAPAASEAAPAPRASASASASAAAR
ncbi:MAG TPA: serine/threonine-protein kinase, partial [Labilithrix sp.]|nr:serine/threonine-protein kinase [Labilithrix sp.]